MDEFLKYWSVLGSLVSWVLRNISFVCRRLSPFLAPHSRLSYIHGSLPVFGSIQESAKALHLESFAPGVNSKFDAALDGLVFSDPDVAVFLTRRATKKVQSFLRDLPEDLT